MKTAALMLGFFVCVSRARGQASGDVSVRLFSTRDVEALTLTPLDARVMMKRCTACTSRPTQAAVTVSHSGQSLLVDGVATTDVELAGKLRLNERERDEAGSRMAEAAGRWRIDVVQGEMRVVVSIPRERYVMAVLAAEAAPDDPPAALRALAVAVRSFAFTEAQRHAAQGFNFCDSTHCQAMRLLPVPARIEEAAEATTGETLWVRGVRAAAYFTQHCGGVTEDSSAVWGGARKSWLVSHADVYCQRAPSQWHAEIAGDDLRAALSREGWVLRGKVEDVRVLTRTTSGRVAKVEVTGQGGQRLTVAGPGFRFAVDRALGWNRLRSDWYTVTFSSGRAVFEGRGYGHGVGLCQAGAHALAAERLGSDPTQVEREILRFYFPGAVVRVGPSDEGWVQREGVGWTLLSVAPDAAVLRAGDAAWARAQALLPVQASTAATAHPVVRVLPDTDLFRQATSEPGWVLGAARGDQIALQPVKVVLRHEAMESLLLHEFLHILVEREAGASTPLWLREGLVEALCGAHGPRAAKNVRVAEIDSALANPGTWEQADAAHREAAVLVQGLVGRFGLSVVRGWLHNGVPAGVLTRQQG